MPRSHRYCNKIVHRVRETKIYIEIFGEFTQVLPRISGATQQCASVWKLRDLADFYKCPHLRIWTSGMSLVNEFGMNSFEKRQSD